MKALKSQLVSLPWQKQHFDEYGRCSPIICRRCRGSTNHRNGGEAWNEREEGEKSPDNLQIKEMSEKSERGMNFEWQVLQLSTWKQKIRDMRKWRKPIGSEHPAYLSDIFIFIFSHRLMDSVSVITLREVKGCSVLGHRLVTWPCTTMASIFEKQFCIYSWSSIRNMLYDTSSQFNSRNCELSFAGFWQNMQWSLTTRPWKWNIFSNWSFRRWSDLDLRRDVCSLIQIHIRWTQSFSCSVKLAAARPWESRAVRERKDL